MLLSIEGNDVKVLAIICSIKIRSTRKSTGFGDDGNSKGSEHDPLDMKSKIPQSCKFRIDDERASCQNSEKVDANGLCSSGQFDDRIHPKVEEVNELLQKVE